MIKFSRANLLLFLSSIIIALLIGEIILRIIQPSTYFGTLESNLKLQRQPLYEQFPGLDSLVYSSTNDMGYRSSEKFAADKFGILTIGGSTTECAFLSDEDTWCHLLQEKLKVSFNENVVIGNVGRSGLHSGHHYLQLKHLTPQFDNIEYVLILLGINDYKRYLVKKENYLKTSEDPKLYRHAFYRYPIQYNHKFYQRTELWMAIRNFKKKYNGWKNARNPKIAHGPMIAQNRLKFNSIVEVDTLPDLSIPLADFEENILKTIQLAKSENIKVVFITQPTLWHEGIDSISSLYCYPLLDRKDYETYTSRVYAKGMDSFNQKLIDLTRKHNVHCIDLANALPKDTTVFYDDCHFNKSGCVKVSEVLQDSLLLILNQN